MRILIIGPGALGCLLAGLLSKKVEVFLLDKDSKRAERLTQQGIFCEGVSGKWQAKVPVITDVAQAGEVDLVIFCVKSYDTKRALATVKDVIKDRTAVLTLQNGLGNVEVLSEVINPDNVIAVSTSLGVTLREEGKIFYAGEGTTLIGNMDGTIPVALKQVREIFNDSKIETKVSRDIKHVIWSKLVINVGINALSAVTGLKNGQLIECEHTAELLRAAVTEAVKVAKKARVKLLFDDALAKVEAVCEATAGNTSSMLQDVLNRKRTEIDFINGVIVRQGKSAGIPTPVNATLLNLVKAIESNYDKSLK